MRFTVRAGTDPVARADQTMLRLLGLPYGGVVRIANTHVLVQGGRVVDSTSLELGEMAMKNAGLGIGDTVEVARAVLGPARQVQGPTIEDLDSRSLIKALQGRPISAGDRVAVDGAYFGSQSPIELAVHAVSPDGAGIVGASTIFGHGGNDQARAGAEPQPTTPTASDALLAGLEAELDLLSGWLALLTSAGNLPTAWGLPEVAGVILEGPHGCGKSELVAAAADDLGVAVTEISLDNVYKPDKLLDVLEPPAKRSPAPAVLFVDRLEVVAGEEGLAPFRSQTAAVLRWFIDAVADRPRVACVLGVSSAENLDPTVANSPLLPRTLKVPPPNLERRKLLFEAALAKAPTTEIDFERVAGRSAGFSGSDVLASVVHASAGVARDRRQITTDDLIEAVDATTPTLGGIPMGEVPTYGFDQVADLKDVKQRLTESVIWPMQDPERFSGLGIEPPRGLLLYGPPGTGKTFVVRALAHEAGAAFLPIKGAELLDKYVGESERAVREVFERARSAAPSIIFFDELDALAPVRGRSTSSVTDTVVAALLTELDGITDRGEVSVIGATNRRDLIDPALLRAGRFEVQLELGLPGLEARRALLDISDVPFGDDIDLDRLALSADGLSFADLTGLLREAALETLRRDPASRRISQDSIDAALARLNRGG